MKIFSSVLFWIWGFFIWYELIKICINYWRIHKKILFVFLLTTVFIGLVPLAFYPFSDLYKVKGEHEKDYNHGPLHQFPDGDYSCDYNPTNIDKLVDLFYIYPIFFMLVISLIIFIYQKFIKKNNIAYVYYLNTCMTIIFLVFQLIFLGWIYD